ncbi:Uncharacterized protein FWK35_00015158 [Aphis craccivora]|uniref:Ubiquitin-like protease family profile domain-containing protein n=1 Tax=Aphis craccivora TaxID=307492 RepID=A0A6G0Z2P2_APHCR|nr:Uncharacterized protein FWK35_00015158 [Aphis craccivora]
MDFDKIDYDFQYLLNEDSYVEDDCVNLFHNILHRYTSSQPCPMDYFSSVQSISPVDPNQSHIQLFFYGENYSEVGHWVCLFYNGESLRIYDGLKGKSVPSSQQKFVDALFPHKPPMLFPDVQAQSNSYDCGVFAIAYATSLALHQNPTFENYINAEMRPHLFRILESRELMQFPSIPRKPRGIHKRDIFMEYNQKENQIIKAEPKMVERNEPAIRLKKMEKEELQAEEDMFENQPNLFQQINMADHRVVQLEYEYREFVKKNNHKILKQLVMFKSSQNIVKQNNHKIL